MPAQDTKAVIERVADALFNGGGSQVLDAVFAEECIVHMRLPPGFPSGIGGLRIWLGELRAGFPDLRCVVEDVIAEGDRAVLRVRAEGTHTGLFMGAQGSGRHAVWTETHTVRLSRGKVVEHWADLDRYGLASQIGLINHRARPAAEGWMV